MSYAATMILDALQPEIVRRVLAGMRGQGQESPQGEEIPRGVELALEAFRKSLSGDAPEAYADFWQQWAYVRCKAGAPLEQVQNGHLVCNEVFQAALKVATVGDGLRQVEILEQCGVLFQGSILAVFQGYEQAREDVLEAQQAHIRKLSTPILPVHAGILVLPLIGVIDTERASDLSGQLLDGIVRFRASVVLVDVTGVPVVDAEVAAHLVQVAGAAALLGAELVLVGLGSEAAAALVHLEEGLGGLRTLADLQAGIEHALRVQGLTLGRRGRVAP